MKWKIALELELGRDVKLNLNRVIVFAHVNPNSEFESLFMDKTKRNSLSTFNPCLRVTRRAHKQENTTNLINGCNTHI